MHVEPFGLEQMTGTAPDLPDQLPNFSADSIDTVDFDKLAGMGIQHVLLDVDATIRYNWDKFINPGKVAHLAQTRQRLGSLSFCLATNNKGSIVRRFADELGGMPVYQPFKLGKETIRKPDIRFFTRILDTEHIVDPKTAVMIGDKALCDIRGANRAGMWSVLVKPFGPDFWFDIVRHKRTRDTQALDLARHVAEEARNTDNSIGDPCAEKFTPA